MVQHQELGCRVIEVTIKKSSYPFCVWFLVE